MILWVVKVGTSLLRGDKDNPTANVIEGFSEAIAQCHKKGDRVVAGRALFGSCHYILTNILPNFGIEVVLIDGQDLNVWERALKKKTKLVFFETPSNP